MRRARIATRPKYSQLNLLHIRRDVFTNPSSGDEHAGNFASAELLSMKWLSMHTSTISALDIMIRNPTGRII